MNGSSHRPPVVYNPHGPYNWGPAITGPRTTPLPTPETILLPRRQPSARGIVPASNALFLAGVYGMLVGMLTGACVGAFFFLVGSIVGVVFGIPTGFVAGLFGAALGRRWGWTLSGALSGAAGGVALAACFTGGFRNGSLLDGWGLLLIAAPCVGGLIAGGKVGGRLQPPGPSVTLTYHDLFCKLEDSGLYDYPLAVRLLLASGHLLAVASVLGEVVRALGGPVR
jgi:hypothetical protein